MNLLSISLRGITINTIAVCFTLFGTFKITSAISQGLDSVFVETYYVADSLDSRYAGEQFLPAGSVTYRVYVDLKPGYVLQSIYGDTKHPLSIATTTTFYNHKVFGRNLGNLIFVPMLPNTTVMLDSWISVGAAAQGNYGVLKTDDDTVETVQNRYHPYQLLQNNDSHAGIPIKYRDGLKMGDPGKVTALNIDDLLTMLDHDQSETNGQLFTTDNGAWACLDGARGADPQTNRVLIGQFTTSGVFSFELNVQIKKQGELAQQFVARDPKGQNVFTTPGLTYSSDAFSGK